MKISDTLQRKCSVMTKKWLYVEAPQKMCSTNHLKKADRIPRTEECVEEMQNLFTCMKKYEFDDLPCASLKDAYLRCMKIRKEETTRVKEIIRDAPLGEQADGMKRLTVGQFNKIMKQYPQPGLGTFPYHKMARLPTQHYSDDLFNRMNTKGKQS